jgi:hypothetical protein
VKSGDRARVTSAVNGLYARYVAAGNAPAGANVNQAARIQGTAQRASGVQPIGSAQELQLLMNSVDYKVNPAFRDHVMARLAASPNL